MNGRLGKLVPRLLEFIQAEFPKQPSAPVCKARGRAKTDSWKVVTSIFQMYTALSPKR